RPIGGLLDRRIHEWLGRRGADAVPADRPAGEPELPRLAGLGLVPTPARRAGAAPGAQCPVAGAARLRLAVAGHGRLPLAAGGRARLVPRGRRGGVAGLADLPPVAPPPVGPGTLRRLRL